MESKINTAELIKNLSDELKEVKPLSHPLKRISIWCAFAITYITLSISLIGLRADITAKIGDSTFLIELILISATSLSAAIASSWLCTPDMRGQKWLLAIPFTLFAILATWIGLRIITEPSHYPIEHWHLCYVGATIFGIVPALSMLYFSKHGRSTHPFISPAMNAISIGGIGYIALRLVCISDDIGHVFVYHTMPFILFALLIVTFGRYIYRW